MRTSFLDRLKVKPDNFKSLLFIIFLIYTNSPNLTLNKPLALIIPSYLDNIFPEKIKTSTLILGFFIKKFC